jgi:hypothetical protein
MTSRQVALRISSRRTSALIRATAEVYPPAGPRTAFRFVPGLSQLDNQP